MKKTAYEVHVQLEGKEKTFLVKDVPVTLGSSQESFFQIPDIKSETKLLLYVEDEALIIKVFDLLYSVESNQKKYKTAKITKSTSLNCGPVQLKIEKTVINDAVDVLDECIIDDSSAPVPPPFAGTVTRLQNEENHYAEVTSHTQHRSSSDNFFNFSIVFDENSSPLSNAIPYSNQEITFEDYIDLEDETKLRLPITNFVVPQKNNSIHIIHSNNGCILNDDYFSVFDRNIFLSSNKHNKSSFAAHDCGLQKSRLIFIKDNVISVLGQQGYNCFRYNKHSGLENIDTSSVSLSQGERIILTKGLSQIFIELSETPPVLKKDNLFVFDERVLKYVASIWTILLLPILLIMFFVEIPEYKKENKKEIAIIYKKKEPLPKPPEPIILEKEPVIVEVKPAPPQEKQIVKEEKKPVKQLAQNSAPPEKKSVTKTELPPKQNLHVAKKDITKEFSPKVETNKKIDVAPLASPKVAKTVDVPTKKKSYVFNDLAQLTSTVSAQSVTINSEAHTQVKMDTFVAGTQNTAATSKPTDGSGTSSLSVSNLDTSSSGNGTGTQSGKGSRGLSGKTSAATSYSEEETKVLGAIDPELIRKILREYIPQFRYCYQKELFKNPSVAGVFDLNFTINHLGKGYDVFIENNQTQFSDNAIGCLSKVVSLIQFPHPKGGGTVDVRQPLNFNKD